MANSNMLKRFRAGLVILVLAVGGCGGGDWGQLSGTVLLNGQPVGPGTITLEPIEADRAGAIASFGEDGKYAVMSRRKEGAPTGEYRVMVHGGEGFGEETIGPKPKSKIPARYNSPSTTDLNVTIEPGENTVDFELKP